MNSLLILRQRARLGCRQKGGGKEYWYQPKFIKISVLTPASISKMNEYAKGYYTNLEVEQSFRKQVTWQKYKQKLVNDVLKQKAKKTENWFSLMISFCFCFCFFRHRWNLAALFCLLILFPRDRTGRSIRRCIHRLVARKNSASSPQRSCRSSRNETSSGKTYPSLLRTAKRSS